VRKGPVTGEGDHQHEGGPGTRHTPARPLSAAKEGTDDSDHGGEHAEGRV